MRGLLAWGLLLAAPILAAGPEAAAKLLTFTLEETPEDVGRVLGRPAATFEQGSHFVWQYFLFPGESHDPSHIFCFRRSDRKLVSVTRNAPEEEDVEALFPRGSWITHSLSGVPGVQYGARSRQAGKGRLLVAMGSAKPGEPTRQLVLIRKSEIRFFLPWLETSSDGGR